MDRDYRAELAESERQHQRAKTAYGGIAGGLSQARAVEEAQRAQQQNPIFVGAYVSSMAEEAQEAAGFFSRNPAFEEFIRLIRKGAIQL